MASSNVVVLNRLSLSNAGKVFLTDLGGEGAGGAVPCNIAFPMYFFFTDIS
jgi:hypothetical protein